MAKFIIHGITCPGCLCNFARTEDEILYIIQINKNRIVKAHFHAVCNCGSLPKAKIIPDEIKYKIANDVKKFRIVCLPCKFFYSLDDIAVVRETGRFCLRDKVYWEIDCKKCEKTHVIRRSIISTLPACVISELN